MQAIALSSRKRTTFFFLIGTGKIKTRQKSTHVDVTSPHPYGFITAGHHLVNSFLRVNFGVGLIHIADLNGFTHLKGSLINLLLPHNHTKQRGFSGSVGTNNPNNTVGWQSKLQTFKQQTFAKSLGHIVRLYHFISQTWTVGNKNLQLLFLLFNIFLQETFISSQTGFGLGLTGLRSHAHPFELTLQGQPALRSLLLFLCQTLGLLVQPRRVIALPGDSLSTIQL